MKRSFALALAAAALPLVANADVRIERIYTDDGRLLVERRYEEPNTVYRETYIAPGAYVTTAPATPVIREYPLQPWPGTDAIHTGANNWDDQALADRVGQAFASDSRLDGITATVVANGGQVSISGSAKSPEQASIAENVARSIAGVANVSGTLSSEGQ